MERAAFRERLFFWTSAFARRSLTKVIIVPRPSARLSQECRGRDVMRSSAA